jgi:glutathionyl-hydroquinone reductase
MSAVSFTRYIQSAFPRITKPFSSTSCLNKTRNAYLFSTRSPTMATTAAPAARSALDEMKSGAFVRKDSVYRNRIEKEGKHPPEADRYHLYVSLACPWACRCVAGLYLKGLQHSIGLSVVHPTWQRTRADNPDDQHTGWAFCTPGTDAAPFSSSTGHGSFPCHDSCIPDNVNNTKFIRDLYELSNDTNGKYTVPILWDKKLNCIVNNESSEILRMFNADFNDTLSKNPTVDLYPEEHRAAIDDINDWVYHSINNGVYKCGFAQSQEAYDTAFDELFSALDKAEAMLTKQRFLLGDDLTEADIRLFVTLIRFDEVYTVYFKTNKKYIKDYPALSNYVRDLYQTKGIKESVDMWHIKTHYYTSHPKLNYYAIVPKGGEAWWEGDHDRHRLAKKPVAWMA